MKTWKIQKFFGDIVYDLRSRGLLPVVILLVVAMVAVPVLISRGSKSSSASLQPAAASVKPSPETETAVVAYHPGGLRNYKQRLNDLSAKDPFQREFAQSAATAGALKSTVTTSTSTGTGTSTPATTNGAPVVNTGGSGGGGHKKKKKKSNATYQVNLLVGDVDTTLTPFNNVQSMAPLPSQSSPAVLFYGLTSDHHSALFLVSNKVGSVTGPGQCVPAPDDCALLTIPQGQSEDLQYAPDGKTYRVVVAEIKRFTK
jgi:hypothetical protein